ncbi:histidine kinase [Mucilaginibacter frigoritolerans]|uniref:Histidine kinase n=1 Tax=Mucilaginibacter frigoritolerans TaxID=652788 RepID=A0A562TR06_9SPHI|nr:histidine kinase [Mucilaginibacter frigoritolerans]TWI95972.1 histidine kinase [Mucilaginibacter frigoritolerans]
MGQGIKIKKYLEPIIHVFIWGCLFFTLWRTAQTLGPFRKSDGSIYPILIWSETLNLALFYFNALYLIPRFISIQRYGTYFLWVISLYVMVVGLNAVLDHFYAISLLSTEKEPLLSEVIINVESKLFVLSLSLGYGLTKQWLKEEIIRQRLIKEKLTAELKYLRGQINPHFLFNTLNMAYSSAIKSGDNVTADIVEKLSGLMRYVLYESNSEEVLLESEINYVNSFINLQIQRLSPELVSQVKYQLNGEWANYKIAPIILIPFIENVFKHGIILSKKSDVSIIINLDANVLILETKNKITTVADKPSPGIGLKNAGERLQLLYSNRHTLSISNDNDIFYVKLAIQL